MKIYNKETIENISNKYKEFKKISRSEHIQFMSIPNTRKSGIVYSMNVDELSEYAKCSNDIIYFAEKYCGIKLFEYQKEMLINNITRRYMINLVSRQIGTSLVESVFCLHKILFNINYKILLFSEKMYINNEIIEKIKTLYCNIPFFLKQGLLSFNKSSIKFENGSEILTSCNINDKEKWFGNDIFILHDFSMFTDDKQQFFMETIYPIILSEKIQFIINSGNSKSSTNSTFYKLIVGAEHKNSPYSNLFYIQKIYWWDFPNRDEKWKEDMIKNIGYDNFMEEFELQFKSKK